MKRTKQVLRVLMSVGFAVLFFFTGYLAAGWSTDAETRKALWIKEMIETHYYEEISPDDVYTVIGRELLDPYSAYYDASAYAELTNANQGKHTGFGFSYYPDRTVALVVLNSPAYHAGLKAGMKLLFFAKDGVQISLETTEPGDALDSLQCKEGEGVEIGTDEGTFYCVRSAYTQSYTEYKTAEHGYVFTGEKELELTETEGLPFPEKTAYLRVTDFLGTVGEEFATLMAIFKEEGMKHLILDLRGNGGGYLTDVQKLSSYLMKDATENRPVAVIAKYKSGKREIWRANGNSYHDYFSPDSQIFVLADEGTASASECLIGVMMDYHTVSYDHILLATENGVAKSYGKGIMQSSFRYRDGSAIKLTVATVHWPVTETCIHGVGVREEDGCIAFSSSHTDKQDATLSEMIAYITDQLA